MATKGTQLINTTLSNLIGGVTEQYQEGRFDSQVSSMTNCIPSISRGVLRRNPLQNIKQLVDSSGQSIVSSDAFVYAYDRGTDDEQYIMVMPGNGNIYVYNANTGTLIDSLVNNYFNTGTSKAKKVLKALTIGDYTFVVNTLKTVQFSSLTYSTAGYSNMAFYWIKKTTSVTVAQYQNSATGVAGSLLKGYDYTLNDTTVEGVEDTRPEPDPGTGVDMNTSTKIAAEFKSLGATVYSKDAIAYTTNFAGTDWKWSDTFGDQASLGVWKNVKDSDELPVNLPEDLDGFIVKVSGGTSAEFDDYYLQYSYDSKSWKEVPSPGCKIELDANTMPHVIYRVRDASGNPRFDAATYVDVVEKEDGSITPTGASKWGMRESGGDDVLEDPSFVGKTISNIFFHKNRLGFITSDSVILSRTGDYGNFFIQTVQEVLDDDPIDLSVASTDVTVLRHAVPTAGQLLLFSDDTQFSLQSTEGTLTPKSADITTVSSYTYGETAPAKAIGNKVYFTNQIESSSETSGGSSQLYAYKVSDSGAQITEAVPMSLHLPTYLPNNLVNITGHEVLGYIFLEEDASKELTVLTTISRGTEDLQNSFHRWSFDYTIASTHIIKNVLHILFVNGYYTKIYLNVPNTIVGVDYTDKYTSLITNTYPSAIKFSEFQVRDSNGKGTVRGRYQLRTLKYTIDEDSYYSTNITDKSIDIFDTDTMYGTVWNSTDTWDSSLTWMGIDPKYTRVYDNTDLVSIMGENKRVDIEFTSSVDNPTKGFELATVNVEGLFYQRSLRR